MIKVTDGGFENVASTKYDCSIFCSGYEQRSSFISTKLNKDLLGEVNVFGFDALSDSPQRAINDESYKQLFGESPLRINADTDTEVFEILQNLRIPETEQVRILVDYSSMSRIWYSAILNWARFAPRRILIDFVYSVGEYSANDSKIVIDDILTIPGCEGGALRFSKAIAVVGLGFHGIMTDCVLDHLEADKIYSFIAWSNETMEYVDRVRASNESVLQRSDKEILIPLKSVATAARSLSELVLPEMCDNEVVIVPMGPKPHVIASIILGLKFSDVSVLRVSSKRQRPELVAPTGEILCTQVEFSEEPHLLIGASELAALA